MIVVTGATGNVGRTLVRILTQDGAAVTAVARNITGPGTVTADLAEPESLRGAFEGADALFLLAAGERPYDVLDVAKAAGVSKVVLVSSQGAGTRPEVYALPGQFEAAVRESGLDWTILRPGGLDSNAFAWAGSIRERRTAAAPFGDLGLPFADPDDVAEVAATVLREDAHTGATYTLTGPALVTPRARVAAIAAVLGEPVTFTEQTRAEAYDLMARFMPLPLVEGTLSILGAPTEEEQRVSPDMERVLGRAPGTFAAWAERNAAAFR